ncbi:sugar kinase [Dictyobacter alpinus]|uniref:Sugar kinase n=1 Tax=Dictyobacter alpinus TaxID=2014873 RepID=A0A402BJP7_9CHLR|nr:ROK family transcriptional regulator [Dictyobacter alpinus]GCE31579.1 sugar kinase [Dictyobacter alpinus]
MLTASLTSRDVRRVNRSIVLHAIYRAGDISRLQLSQSAGLSVATVTNVVAELLAEGILLEAGLEPSNGGRPRTILRLNREYGYFFGAEIGETDVVVELFDLTLRNLRTAHYFLHGEENHPTKAVQCVIEGVTTLLAALAIPAEKVLGMGLGVLGLVDHTDNDAVLAPSWQWQRVPLKALISQALPIPLFLDNGSKTMALAELRKREVEAGAETMIVVNLGTGVGAGIIYEGKLYRGKTNSAGEWGHTVMALDGAVCRCGHRGCLEAYIGASAIIRRFTQLVPTSPLVSNEDEMQALSAILEAAQQGDGAAIQVLHDTAHYLGAGLANLINLFNPQSIIMGGWVGTLLGPYLLPEVRQFVARYALESPFGATQILVSQLGKDAGSIGAALLAHDSFFTSGIYMIDTQHNSLAAQ